MEAFYADREASRASVDNFAIKIQQRGAKNIEKSEEREYDLSFFLFGVDYYVEMKHDRMAENTGNVAIETESRGKPSGLSTTTASHWCYLIGENYYLIRTHQLQALIRENSFKIVMGGDDKSSKLYLIPVSQFKASCRRLFDNPPAYLLSFIL